MISNNFKKRFFTSLGLLISVFLIFSFNLFLAYVLIVLGTVAILEFINILKKILKKNLMLVIINFMFVSYIFIFCFMFFFFSNFIGLKITLYTILFGCIFSDIGGFIFGKIFKGPKLTKISPNKTYSGAIGSVISTLIIVSLIFYYYFGTFNFSIILISIMTSIFCQIGDLIFSFLKRKAKIKDTGNFLPGHGGVLDRLDGILLGLPIGLLTLIILN